MLLNLIYDHNVTISVFINDNKMYLIVIVKDSVSLVCFTKYSLLYKEQSQQLIHNDMLFMITTMLTFRTSKALSKLHIS